MPTIKAFQLVFLLMRNNTFAFPKASRTAALLAFACMWLCSGLAGAQSGAVPCPANIDFSYANFTNWQLFTGSANCGGACANTSGSSPVFGNAAPVAALPGRIDIMNSSGNDPYGGFPRTITANSMRLGSDSAGYSSERATYTMHIPVNFNDYSIRFKVAAVFNDTGFHSAHLRPAFTIRAIDSATGNYLPCASLTYTATSAGTLRSTVNPMVRYMPWRDGTLNLSGQASKTIIIEATALDCGDGAHWAYGYLRFESCRSFRAEVIVCNKAASTLMLAAPPGYAKYEWYAGPVINGSPLYTDLSPTYNALFPAVSGFYFSVMTPYSGNGCIDTVRSRTITNWKLKAMPDGACNNIDSVKKVWAVVSGTTVFTQYWTSNPFLGPDYIDGQAPDGKIWVKPHPPGTHFTVTIADSLGCYNQDVVWNKPKIFTAGPMKDTTVCPGQHFRLSPAIAPLNLAYTYRWTSTYAATKLDDTAVLNPVYTSIRPGYDTLEFHATALGCEAIDDIRIRTLDTTLTVSGDTVCEGAYFTPSLQGDSSLFYTWSPTTGVNPAEVHQMHPRILADTTRAYTVTASYPGCPDVAKTITLNVEPLPRPALGRDTAYKCPADLLAIHAAVAPIWYNAYQFLWDAHSDIDDVTSSQINFRGKADTTLYLTVSTLRGCTGRDSVRVMVYPTPFLTLPESDTIFLGESLELKPVTDAQVFIWSPAQYLSNTYARNPVARPAESTTYVLTAGNEWGCAATDSTRIYVVDEESGIAVPNAFIPGSAFNGEVRVLHSAGPITLHYFRIFNRWGKLVFETSNPSVGWDGNYHSAAQPQGVYAYSLEVVTNKGTIVRKRGNITLLR